jgi:hypothetical protein
VDCSPDGHVRVMTSVTVTEQRPVADSFQYSNEHSGSIQVGGSLEWQRDYFILKKHPTTLYYVVTYLLTHLVTVWKLHRTF